MNFTCRSNTDNNLRVASCISPSRATAKESTCNKIQPTGREREGEYQVNITTKRRVGERVREIVDWMNSSHTSSRKTIAPFGSSFASENTFPNKRSLSP